MKSNTSKNTRPAERWRIGQPGRYSVAELWSVNSRASNAQGKWKESKLSAQ